MTVISTTAKEKVAVSRAKKMAKTKSQRWATKEMALIS